MSIIKRYMEDQEARYQQGLDLCLQAGAIKECDNHPGTYFEGGEPVEAAYRLAARQVTSGTVGGTQREVTDAVRTAYDDNAALDCCQECEEVFG